MDYERPASLLKAMGHPVRLQILDMLRLGETCVCHIENALDQRQAYVSQQLMSLRQAGLVTSRKDGLRVYYWLGDAEVERMLQTLLGPAAQTSWQALPGCDCPQCKSTIPLSAIPTGETSCCR